MLIGTLTVTPVFVFSEEYIPYVEDEDALTFEETSKTREAEIICENKEKADRYQKNFFLDDGSFLTTVYPEAVHYKDGGEWKEIDNSLVSAKDERGKEVFINAAYLRDYRKSLI
ncbi:MAG: hypothetical protein IJU01_02700 [Lachnospiraceae bacterium]|nr:hypothetical protein [Lachnospiraceae bacterium]